VSVESRTRKPLCPADRRLAAANELANEACRCAHFALDIELRYLYSMGMFSHRRKKKVSCGGRYGTLLLREKTLPPSLFELPSSPRLWRDNMARLLCLLNWVRLRLRYGATRCYAQLGAHIRFCETNPPFWEGILNVTYYEYVVCHRNS
jgi:hypothetical protein